jgi:exodeoxyribonuclease VII large subunit
MKFRPEDGMQVIVSGRITLYEARGAYQIDAWSIKPLGVGELQIAFDRLKAKLEKEGLFDASRKRALPEIPAKIGIVTSPTGAALHDMLTVIRRRYPFVEVILRPAQVQGAGAAEDIAQGIKDIVRLGGLDVIIIGRGGGSVEDLWAFNEEVVARAIAQSPVPIVSAVGHEVDYTIADYVADLRAPTPSAAAELVVPSQEAILDQLTNSWYTIRRATHHLLDEYNHRLTNLLTGYAFARPADLVRQYSQRVDDLQNSVSISMVHQIELLSARHMAVNGRLDALDPRLPLRRGFAMVRKAGTIVSSSSSLTTGDDISVEFQDGAANATVTSK